MKHFRLFLLLFATIFGGGNFILAQSNPITVNGINYDIDLVNKTATLAKYTGDAKYEGEITIPSKITYEGEEYTITAVGEEAFLECAGITKMTLPSTIESIGDKAFYAKQSLSYDLYLGATAPPSKGEDVFNTYSDMDFTYFNFGRIYVPYGSEGVYEDAGWDPYLIFQNGVWTTGGIKYTIKSATPAEVEFMISYDAPEDVVVPATVTDPYFNQTYSVVAISGTIGNENTKTITLPNTITEIPDYTFINFTSLTTVNIPASVTTIGKEAFIDCETLTTVNVEGANPAELGSYVFDKYIYDEDFYYYRPLENVRIYVPYGCGDKYKEAWTRYADKIVERLAVTIGETGNATFCAGQAIDFSNTEGLKAYAATGYDSETGDVVLTRVMQAKAGMGLFLSGDAGTYELTTLESTTHNSLNMLKGTLETTTVNATDGDYTNYKYTIVDDVAAFYPLADNSTINAGKAYLQIPTSWLPAASEARTIGLRFDDSATTGIDENIGITDKDNAVYDLMGRKVKNPTKGLYIVNGKKVLVK